MLIKLTESNTHLPVYVNPEQMLSMRRFDNLGYTNIGIIGDSLPVVETPEEILAMIEKCEAEKAYRLMSV